VIPAVDDPRWRAHLLGSPDGSTRGERMQRPTRELAPLRAQYQAAIVVAPPAPTPRLTMMWRVAAVAMAMLWLSIWRAVHR
jgi:hypothetical protein